VCFTDERKYFVSEASVYRLLKAHDLITSPAYVVIKAANEFKEKTTAINQLWQTDFTYLKITGWGWYYLSTVLDDFSRYIVARRLGPTMCASDVTATLDQALAASGFDHITVGQRPRRVPGRRPAREVGPDPRGGPVPMSRLATAGWSNPSEQRARTGLNNA
jgi:putative transposase